MKWKEEQLGVCGCRKDERQSVEEHVENITNGEQRKKREQRKEENRNYGEMGWKRWQKVKN